ncbi:DUF1801 domain-containing protein [Planctomonas psychrotolerans]|uniref:DUF1801 domain-containing protein n=1 Tax=Planctomonas psychrotolerans TaxID=2528712 RepID=UPI001238D307|nr:DUF1801 domain-containing protein [Planctomonas psychrotolerans]
MEAVPDDVTAYLDRLPEAKRAEVLPVFHTVHSAMPDGYELSMLWRMPTWSVPLATYPRTYNGQPLAFVSLAAQKNYCSLYLMALAGDSAEERIFRTEWTSTGRALNMGKSCLRFRSVDDLDLDLIASTIAATPVARFLDTYERIHPS